MKKLAFLTMLFVPAALPAQTVPAAEPAAQEETAAQDPAERSKMLYSLGYLLGDNLKKQLILDNEDDYKALSQGMRDTIFDRKSQTDLEEYKPQIIRKYQEDAQIISAKREAAQQEYIENFKREKGAKVLDNGAVIVLTRKGKGKNPKADSTVKVHYEGTLLDGTKFDSSYDRQEPFQTKLTDVIPCWTKAVQQMKPGAKARVLCPADTAYGNRPVGPIPPNSALLFNIELLEMDL